MTSTMSVSEGLEGAIFPQVLPSNLDVDTLSLTPRSVALSDLHRVIADIELEEFGAAKPTDSSCYGQTQPCTRTCC